MAPRALDTHAGIDVAKVILQSSASRCNIWSDSGYGCYQHINPKVQEYFLNISFVAGDFVSIANTAMNRQYSLQKITVLTSKRI